MTRAHTQEEGLATSWHCVCSWHSTGFLANPEVWDASHMEASKETLTQLWLSHGRSHRPLQTARGFSRSLPT